jgi:hypothetical protein
MAKLQRFDTPAGIADRHPDPWSRTVAGLIGGFAGKEFPQFYNPMKKDTPPSAQEPMVSWVGFPATLKAKGLSDRVRWDRADRDRSDQDEYCEWAVDRDPRTRKIKRITFTTELPEYWKHLFETDPARLLALYRKFVDPRVQLSEISSKGRYLGRNKWNDSQQTPGAPSRLAHMIQGSNNLGAAIALVAQATILRQRNGKPVVNQQDLVICGRLGEPLRHSDPQIAAAVNQAARSGAELTFTNPVGLYLGRPLTAGMRTPDGADAASFWKVERGDAVRTLRARFEVPASKKYTVGDIKIGNQPIEFGGQVADRVQVWVSVTVKKGSHKPTPQPCVG